MFINLNKKLVTKEGILEHISDIDIYRLYTGKEVKLAGGLLSPLREEESPSFGYFHKNGEILFKDFVVGGGDCIRFVQLLFGLDYFEALSKIVIDFNLEDNFHYKKISKATIKSNIQYSKSRIDVIAEKSQFKLEKQRRSWKEHDKLYWSNFGITLPVLKRYNVEPLRYIFINDRPIRCDKFAYCFIEYKDGKETYKIYQPFSTMWKWITDHNESVWQGWEQMPDNADELIVTKSLKDVMAITNVLKIPAVSLQAESVLPKEQIIEELTSRFKKISIWYDNDFDGTSNWGRILGDKIQELFKTNSRYEIPEEYKSKDFSDLVKNYNKNKAKQIFKNKIQ